MERSHKIQGWSWGLPPFPSVKSNIPESCPQIWTACNLIALPTKVCGIRWWSRRTCSHLLLWELQNYNSLLNNCRLENVGSHQKKIPYVQGQRRSPSKMVWGQNHVYLFFFNFFLFLNLTILYWFCQILKWIRHRYTCVPHPEPSSLLHSHTIPLGRPSAPAPSIQYRALNLDWRLISYMILYMFQCHSPRSSHPLPLPQSP